MFILVLTLSACSAADVPKKAICSDMLTEKQVKTFQAAVRKHYWYELFVDDLPIWGFVGPPPEETKDEDHIYIYTHKSFDINYNGNRVSPAPQIPCRATLLRRQPNCASFSWRSAAS